MASPTTFHDLNFTDGFLSGIRATVFFPNGYGASVIRSRFSHGGKEGYYELAVLKGNAKRYRLTYSTPITSDVLGHLTPEEVTKKLQEIAQLNPTT